MGTGVCGSSGNAAPTQLPTAHAGVPLTQLEKEDILQRVNGLASVSAITHQHLRWSRNDEVRPGEFCQGDPTYIPCDEDPPPIVIGAGSYATQTAWTETQMRNNHTRLMRLYKWAAYFGELAQILERRIETQQGLRDLRQDEDMSESEGPV